MINDLLWCHNTRDKVDLVKKVTFGDSDPGFSLAIKEWTGTAPGFPSGVTNVYFWLLSCIRTSYCLGPAWGNLCVDNVKLNVEVKGNWGDLLRLVPRPIVQKISLSFLCGVYLYVFNSLLDCIWWKNTWPSSIIFFLILSLILHASCPDMIIEVFSELYEYEVLNW